LTTVLAADSLQLDRILRPGDQIVASHACGEPTTLIEALVAQRSTLRGISLFVGSSFSPILSELALADEISISSMGAIGSLRTLAKAGKLSIVPCHVGQIATMIEQGVIRCDVVFVQVSPSDASGNHSYGLINDYMQSAIAKARTVVAEVNARVPFSTCDTLLSRERINFIIEVSRAPVELPAATPSNEDLAIARNAAVYIEDGSILQVGIGVIPDAIMQLLRDRREIGIHSGMIGDGLVDLVERGVVTNATKEIDRGISVTGALIGSQRLFDFAHRNPTLCLRSSRSTHGEAILSTIRNLVTINSAIEVDLTGQVNAEQAGLNFLGAVGGQIDFVRAGSRSAHGRSLIVLPSTALDGAKSRIVSRLNGPVTTARSEIDVIITEFGAAELKGQSLATRARRLVAVAHPRLRENLDKEAYVIAKRGF